MSLTELVASAVNKRYEALSVQAFRTRIGVSTIGSECERKMWYDFRWVALRKVTARTMRIFDRGIREEDTMLRMLNEAGLVVFTRNQEGKQYSVELAPHIGGSLDGILAVPAHLQAEYGEYCTVEAKTHKEKSFIALRKAGVKLAQPTHYTQGNAYAYGYGHRGFLYIALNKNTEELYYEWCPLDAQHAIDSVTRAYNVALATQKQDTAKIAMSAESHECRNCAYKAQCWFDEPAQVKSCRSCSSCYPQQDGTFVCGRSGELLHKNDPCDEWESII